jgi:hypothetical protein
MEIHADSSDMEKISVGDQGAARRLNNALWTGD